MLKISDLYNNKLGILKLKTPKFDLYSVDGNKYRVSISLEVRNNKIVGEKARSFFNPNEVIDITNEPTLFFETEIRKHNPETKGYQKVSRYPELYKKDDTLKGTHSYRTLEVFQFFEDKAEELGNNSLRAGSHKQTKLLKDMSESRKKELSYEEKCDILKENNLLTDQGYRYGSGWLFRQIKPQEIEELIKALNILGANIEYEYDMSERDDAIANLKRIARKSIFNKESIKLGF